MSVKTHPTGPVFPVSPAVYHPITIQTEDDPRVGLTVRAYIATAAMSGILSGSAPDRITDIRTIVNLSVELADKLIAELNKPQPPTPTTNEKNPGQNQ